MAPRNKKYFANIVDSAENFSPFARLQERKIFLQLWTEVTYEYEKAEKSLTRDSSRTTISGIAGPKIKHSKYYKHSVGMNNFGLNCMNVKFRLAIINKKRLKYHEIWCKREI